MTDITTIPAERLALLDSATLFYGSGDLDSGKRCARELMNEIVTGTRADVTPPGMTRFIEILSTLNDGPWRDNAHRTNVMRPYLLRFIALDPTDDEARLWRLLDYTLRHLAPMVLDGRGMTAQANKLRAMPRVVDRETAKGASTAALATDLAWALGGGIARNFGVVSNSDLINARVSAIAIARSGLPATWEAVTRTILDIICAPVEPLKD